MGECLILKSGGGTDTSDATSTASQILSGYTAYVNDNLITGTMANNGAVSSTLNCGGSYTIPAGYHNGSGVVTVNSLSSQTSATASTAQILSGYTAWVNGSRLTGSMTNRGSVTYTLGANGTYTIPSGWHSGSGYVNQSIPVQGGWTITPSTGNIVCCWAGWYTSGDIWVAGNGNLTAGNIKKGVWIFGVYGTWSGVVPAATDLYWYGTNNGGFVGRGDAYANVAFEGGDMRMWSTGHANLCYITSNNFNFAGYSNIYFEFLPEQTITNSYPRLAFMVYNGNGSSSGGNVIVYRNPYSSGWTTKGTSYVAQCPISSYQWTFRLDVEYCGYGFTIQVRHIWVG